MARRKPASKERLAFHEAGHAVVALEVGFKLKKVGVKADYDSQSWGSFTLEPFENEPHPLDRCQPLREIDGKAMFFGVALTMIHLGGFAAESILRKRRVLRRHSRDYGEALNYAKYLCGLDAEVDAFIEWIS